LNTNRLQAALDYEFSPEEVKVFKIALIWEELTAKHFPKDKGVARLSKGDPRKCSLFKFCWRFVRETRGLLRDGEYKLFVEANLQILKSKGGHLSPNVLCGDKAWIRWKVWKRIYDQKLAEHKGYEPPSPVLADPKVVKELDKTKRFLHEKCEGVPTLEHLQGFLDNQSLQLWIMTNKISYYYVVLSPFVAKVCSLPFLEKTLLFDSKVFLEKAGEHVKNYFKSEFAYEYQP